MALTLYTYPGNPRANKALISAQYNGVDIKIPAGFVMGESNKTPEFLALNPLGKVPTLETAEGGIFESNAIARYVAGLKADTQLLGGSYFESAQVQQWQDFSNTHLDLPLSNWVYQILGWMQFNPQITKKAQQDVQAALKIMDSHLLDNAFLVGSKITLADITLVCSLHLGYVMVFEPAYRSKFPNVNRWFTTCVNQPEFAAIMGDVTLCEKMQQAAAPKKEKAAKKEKTPQQPKKEKKAAAAPTEKKAEKPKNKLDLLPKSPMVLDEWKRQYSNLDTVGPGSACEWLDKNFDADGWSWWFVDNMYADEQEQAWKAANLLSGFVNRWELCRKYSFGVMLIDGVDKKGGMVIEGVFLFRGQDVIWEFTDIPDYETYKCTRVDLKDPKQKKKMEAILSYGEYGTEGALSGPCLDGKQFK